MTLIDVNNLPLGKHIVITNEFGEAGRFAKM